MNRPQRNFNADIMNGQAGNQQQVSYLQTEEGMQKLKQAYEILTDISNRVTTKKEKGQFNQIFNVIKALAKPKKQPKPQKQKQTAPLDLPGSENLKKAALMMHAVSNAPMDDKAKKIFKTIMDSLISLVKKTCTITGTESYSGPVDGLLPMMNNIGNLLTPLNGNTTVLHNEKMQRCFLHILHTIKAFINYHTKKEKKADSVPNLGFGV